jgi:hypothetical protein
MYLDQWLNYSSWHTLFTGLISEWQGLILYVSGYVTTLSDNESSNTAQGTLILNTNVAFLAIPGTGVSPAAQLSSYISMCFGLGSIIMGRILCILKRNTV